MKYGIFGGTFDPPHLEHMRVARSALESLGLDEVIWIPAFRSPFKTGESTDARKRLAMCKLAVSGEERMSVSDIDITRQGPSYLVDTLTELKMVMPGEYWFIAGSDAIAGFKKWMRPEKVLRQCRIALISRPGTDLETTVSRFGEELTRHVDMVEIAMKAVSSTNIRDKVISGESVEHLLAPAVQDYIIRTGLYRD